MSVLTNLYLLVILTVPYILLFYCECLFFHCHSNFQMKGVEKIKIIKLRDTEEPDNRHNRPRTVLTDRAKTFESFMKKEAISKMIVSIRQKSTRSKVKHKTEGE